MSQYLSTLGYVEFVKQNVDPDEAVHDEVASFGSTVFSIYSLYCEYDIA